MRKFLLSFLLAISATAANADVLTADIKSAADLPYCCQRSGPLTAEYSGAIGSGFEINGSTAFDNPSIWSGGRVFIDLNPSTGLLTLDSQDNLDFQTYVLTIDNLTFDAGQYLRGLSLVSDQLTTNAAAQFSFTGNSLRIAYDSRDIFNFTTNNAVFQLDIGQRSDVPEPANLALFGLALAALAGARRRKT